MSEFVTMITDHSVHTLDERGAHRHYWRPHPRFGGRPPEHIWREAQDILAGNPPKTYTDYREYLARKYPKEAGDAIGRV